MAIRFDHSSWRALERDFNHHIQSEDATAAWQAAIALIDLLQASDRDHLTDLPPEPVAHALLGALRRHPAGKNVQYWGCLALHELCEKFSALRHTLQRDPSGLATARAAVKVYPLLETWGIYKELCVWLQPPRPHEGAPHLAAAPAVQQFAEASQVSESEAMDIAIALSLESYVRPAQAARPVPATAKAAPVPPVAATMVEDYSSYEYIARHTQNFSNDMVLGRGVYGTVYHGIGCGPKFVEFAAKRLECTDEQQRERLERMTEAEIRVLTTFAHPNIISLLGHCRHPDGAILVYDYQPGGSLDQKLREAEATPQLTWGRRSCIVSGLMSAVSYLHHHDSKGPCYHRDIKPANIMLTISLSPKLSDCGLSRFLPQDRPDQSRRTMQLTTGAGPAGTPGFMCQRYISNGQFDAKSEVYSIGITILQLITAEQEFNSAFQDLIEDLIESADPEEVRRRHDARIPPTHSIDQEILQKLCAMAVASVQPYRKRIDVMPLLRQAQECSALQTPAEIPALKNELEQLHEELRRFRLEEQAALQARKACELCFEQCSGEGSLQCPNGHVVCRTCASGMVDSKLDEVGRSDTMLQSHRAAGGRIPCVKNNPAIQPRCTTHYSDQALARSLPDETFLSYRAAQDQTIEDRIWNEQNRRFQEQVAQIERRLRERQANQQHEEAASVEFLRRQYPNARMCPRCSCGPVINENCFDLHSHHGEARGRSRINNACQQCGFFTSDWNQWLPWDGVLRQQRWI